MTTGMFSLCKKCVYLSKSLNADGFKLHCPARTKIKSLFSFGACMFRSRLKPICKDFWGLCFTANQRFLTEILYNSVQKGNRYLTLENLNPSLINLKMLIILVFDRSTRKKAA